MKIPDWVPAEPWAAYVEMRKKNKKGMTDYTIKQRLEDLARFRDAGFDLKQVLDQSTTNNYTGLFAPKEHHQVTATPNKVPQLGKHGNATAAAAQEWLNESAMDDTLEQKRKFASLLTHMSDYYKDEISRAKLSIYWEGLRQYSFDAIQKACWAHTQSPDEAGRWMPRNSDIIKIIEGGTQDRSMIAWSKVDSAIRHRGTWDDVVFDDAVIHRVIADMGGWVLIGSKDDKEWPFIGKEFQTRYRAYKQKSEQPECPARLTGIANAQNASQGMPLLPPILIGDVEKCKLVLKGNSMPQIGLQRTQLNYQPT